MTNVDIKNPENLASALRRLKLGAVNTNDVEWMYTYPAAVPLLESIQKMLSSGEECLIPQDSDDASSIPADVFAPVLLALPSTCAKASSSSLLAASLRAAQCRLQALQRQRVQLEELAASSSKNQRFQPSATFFTSDSPYERKALSHMRHAIDHAKQGIACALANAKVDATVLDRLFPEFLRVERQLCELVRRFESESRNIPGHAYESCDETQKNPHLHGNYYSNIVELFAEGCASVEEERILAIANLARATAWYQSLRQFRREEHRRMAGMSPVSSKRGVLEAYSRWTRQLSDEVCPLANTIGYDSVRARARARHLEARISRQRGIIADTSTANRILALQRLRLTTMAEVLRVKIGALRSISNSIATSFLDKRYGPPNADHCFGASVTAESGSEFDCSSVAQNKIASGAAAKLHGSALQSGPLYSLGGRLRGAGYLLDKYVIGTLARILFDFCRSVRSDTRGIALETTELYANGVRSLQTSVIEAGELLDDLLRYYNSRETESLQSNATSRIWTGFFAPRHQHERLEYLISLRQDQEQ